MSNLILEMNQVQKVLHQFQWSESAQMSLNLGESDSVHKHSFIHLYFLKKSSQELNNLGFFQCNLKVGSSLVRCVSSLKLHCTGLDGCRHLRMSVTEDGKIPNTCGQFFNRQKVTATTENTKVANRLSTCQILHQEPQRNVILVAGRQDAGGDSVEFLFQMAENMARVVGVGFNRSKVVVNRQYDVSIIHVGESAWSDLWNEVWTEATPHNDSNSFSLMNIEFLTTPTEQVDTMDNLTAQESSKRFGVGLEGSGLRVHVYADDNNRQSGEDFPLIFSLVEHMGFKRENAKDLGKQHSGTSSSKATSSGNDTQTSTKEEKCLPQQNQGPTKKNHGDNEDEDHPPEDSGLQQHSQSPIDPKDTSLIVIVIPESGGIFHRGSTNDIEYPRDSIKLAAIAPRLEFKFEKLGNYRKITTTTKTQCHLGGGEPKYPELDCGYYQNNITISLNCEKEDAARLSSSRVTAIVSTKQTTVETFTDSSSLARQTGGQIGGQVQIPVVGIGLQAQGNMNVTSTIGGSSSLAESEEISNTQLAGFSVNPADLEGSQVYNFLYCTDVLRLIENNPAKFISAGICRTLLPTIVGEWDALDMDDACLYNFKTERDLMSIGDLMQSSAAWKVPYMRQRYQVPFFINHAMTHLGRYGTPVLIKGPGEQRLENVLTKYPAIA